MFFFVLENVSGRKKKFGRNCRVGQKVCQFCLRYFQCSAAAWKDAWPTVLSSLIHDTSLLDDEVKILYAMIPSEIKQSWKHRFDHLHPSIREQNVPSLVSDTTQRRSIFDAHVNSGSSERLEKALDQEAYPNCRCPFGCFTFVEETGFIPFHHLINGLIPSFVSFESSFNSHFRGIRSDWSTPSMFWKNSKFPPLLSLTVPRVLLLELVLITTMDQTCSFYIHLHIPNWED